MRLDEHVHGDRIELAVPDTDKALGVIRYGHWGRPVIVFPSEGGRAEDFANNGMVDAVRDLVDDGRVSFFCVDSADQWTWSDNDQPTESRARNHQFYSRWLTDAVVPHITQQTGGALSAISLGASMGAYHAVHFTLTNPHLAPLALGLSGNYDPTSWHGWGDIGDATYFANPMSYVAGMNGTHLDWVRQNASVLLVVGQGAFEWHPTRSLPSTRDLAAVLQGKGIPCELDEWGVDSAHDWPWWQKQLAHHLPRFC